jgi:hypothetical protein
MQVKNVTFHTRSRFFSSNKTIKVTLEVPIYYPTGNMLTRSDMERYILDAYGFEVIHWMDDGL